MKYQFFINFNKAVPSWSEFWPTNDVEAIKKRPADQEFYQEEVGDIKINRKRGDKDNSTVYDLLETWFTDATKFSNEIEIEIYRGTMAGTLYYAGFFSISDPGNDNEYKTFNITPRIDDEYRTLLELRDVKFEVRNTISDVDVILPIEQAVAVWTPGSPGSTIPQDWDVFTPVGGDNKDLIVEDTDGANKESRHTNIGTVLTGGVVVVNVSAFANADVDDPWIDIIDGADSSLTAGAQQVTGTGIFIFDITASVDPAYLLLFSDPAADTPDFSMTFTLAVSNVGQVDGSLFIDFIEDFIDNRMGLGAFAGKVKSTFLRNDALPSDAPSSIDTFMTANPNGNYVSENTSANPLNGFIITETRLWVSADVTENRVSFLEIMSNLKEVLEAGWYIDADGDFRIEHIKYFEKLVEDSTAIDLTSAPFEKYKTDKDNNELTFNKALLGNREQFAWQQVDTIANSQDFIGVDIIYDNLETIENVLKHEPRIITTDVVYLHDNPDDASADGFVFVQCVLASGIDYLVQEELGVLTDPATPLNAHFAWANLQDKYWTWRRMSENGDMNNGDTVAFESAIKFLEQANIRFGFQTTLDGFTKITTNHGTGQQAEAKRNLETDFITIVLRYNPYA